MSTRKIIRKIAKEYGVSPKEVKAEMEQAFSIGMSSSSPAVRKNWEKIAPNGKIPSIDTFLKVCVGQITKLQ